MIGPGIHRRPAARCPVPRAMRSQPRLGGSTLRVGTPEDRSEPGLNSGGMRTVRVRETRGLPTFDLGDLGAATHSIGFRVRLESPCVGRPLWSGRTEPKATASELPDSWPAARGDRVARQRDRLLIERGGRNDGGELLQHLRLPLLDVLCDLGVFKQLRQVPAGEHQIEYVLTIRLLD